MRLEDWLASLGKPVPDATVRSFDDASALGIEKPEDFARVRAATRTPNIGARLPHRMPFYANEINKEIARQLGKRMTDAIWFRWRLAPRSSSEASTAEETA